MSVQARVLLIVFIMTAVVFYPITILLSIGMLPTIIVRLVDRTPERTKVLTVGFMNFAGCFPYCYQVLQSKAYTAALADTLLDPLTIVIMYAAALVGYIIEWGVVGFVASLMVQKGRNRLVEIKKEHEALAKKWGQEVVGDKTYDPRDFAEEKP